MTRGADRAFKRRLALEGIGLATAAALLAPTIGANILRKWGVSSEALLLTVGIILFLVALRSVLAQYSPADDHVPAQAAAPPATTSAFSFTPLAFPTIITPYGIALLVFLVTLPEGAVPIASLLVLVALVLALDLVAMLFADRILGTPVVAGALRLLGATLGVLQVALGVQAIVGALRLLGLADG
jgi:multiple antibiotic resistance protein